jgi:hypothetical protein
MPKTESTSFLKSPSIVLNFKKQSVKFVQMRDPASTITDSSTFIDRKILYISKIVLLFDTHKFPSGDVIILLYKVNSKGEVDLLYEMECVEAREMYSVVANSDQAFIVGGLYQNPAEPADVSMSGSIELCSLFDLTSWKPLRDKEKNVITLHKPRANPLLSICNNQLIVAGGINIAEKSFIQEIEIINLETRVIMKFKGNIELNMQFEHGVSNFELYIRQNTNDICILHSKTQKNLLERQKGILNWELCITNGQYSRYGISD